jgi:hypothetical protein
MCQDVSSLICEEKKRAASAPAAQGGVTRCGKPCPHVAVSRVAQDMRRGQVALYRNSFSAQSFFQRSRSTWCEKMMAQVYSRPTSF